MKKFSVLLAIFFAIFSLAVPLNSDEAPDPQYSYVLMEGSTATLLYQENGSARVPAHHAAKLMTLLLAAEKIDSGEMSFDDILKTSAHANSMQGAQIWLMPGEEISVGEIIKSLSVGNANDACVVMAERLGGTEEDFVKIMNKKADALGMTGTKYFDSTGISSQTVTTACDTAILASELLKYPFLTPYFTTWVDSVRGGKTELASENRLILSYTGATGMKAYYKKEIGNCVIATAERNDMKLVCVIFGETDPDQRFKTAKEKLNAGFSAYTLFKPKLIDLYPEPVLVKGGEKTEVETEIYCPGEFVIRKSQADKLEAELTYGEPLKAPVKRGDEAGRVIYSVDGEELFSLKIVAKEDIKKMDILVGIRRILGHVGL